MIAAATLALLAAGCGRPGDETTAKPPIGTGKSFLDGRERSLVIVGHSTSYVWPAMLQEILDAHSGGERRVHVLNASVGGSPVSRWIAEERSDDYRETFGAMVRDFFGEDARLRGDAPSPTIALCQQSLQFTGSSRGPIADAEDGGAVRAGADALEMLALRLHERGIEHVHIATHIYKESGEPEIGNERLALAALLDRGHEFVFAGPDLWARTRDAYPDAFNEDGVHPSPLGMKIMAEHWYRALAGDEARQDAVDRLYATEFDIETLMTDHINRRRP
jgi:hypothetical protein